MGQQTSGLDHLTKHTDKEITATTELCHLFESSSLPLDQRLRDFPRHTRRQDLARFLAKYELFKQSLSANGSIVECGVYAGGGITSWMHFSSILEPYNHSRRVIGFDTFTGFPAIHPKDTGGTSEHLYTRGFQVGVEAKQELEHFVQVHDHNRPLGHIRKLELVEGDACQTIPNYLEKHPYLIVSLLYLDFDIYEPTKAALTHLYPRVVKGGVVAFDELNCAEFPGETIALLETIELARVPLHRFPFDPYISYFVKE